MSKTIKVDDVQKVIMDYLTNYKEDIEEEVIDTVDEITKEARDELKKTSPRRAKSRKDQYYKGWTVKMSKRKTGVYHKVIWNKTNYQLTHLLEFEHATRNGKRTKAQPHIRPVEEKYNVKFVDTIKDRIRRVSK